MLYLNKTDYAFLRRLLARGTITFNPLNLYHLKAVLKLQEWKLCTVHIGLESAEAFLVRGESPSDPKNRPAVTAVQLNALIDAVKELRVYKRTNIRRSPRRCADFIQRHLLCEEPD